MSRELRFIGFRAGPETFLIDIMAVRQIVSYGGSTRVPTAPEFIEGVIVVRDEAIPVIDVHARLYPEPDAQPEQPMVLLTQTAAGHLPEIDCLASVAQSRAMALPRFRVFLRPRRQATYATFSDADSPRAIYRSQSEHV